MTKMSCDIMKFQRWPPVDQRVRKKSTPSKPNVSKLKRSSTVDYTLGKSHAGSPLQDTWHFKMIFKNTGKLALLLQLPTGGKLFKWCR